MSLQRSVVYLWVHERPSAAPGFNMCCKIMIGSTLLGGPSKAQSPRHLCRVRLFPLPAPGGCPHGIVPADADLQSTGAWMVPLVWLQNSLHPCDSAGAGAVIGARRILPRWTTALRLGPAGSAASQAIRKSHNPWGAGDSFAYRSHGPFRTSD